MGPINAVDDMNTNSIKEQNNGTAITYQQIASKYLKNLISIVLSKGGGVEVDERGLQGGWSSG